VSSIDLIILGQLMSGPKSAYQMKKELETWNVSHWVKISAPTVYKNLVKLHKKGFLDAQIVREGEMPEKRVYHINGAGSEYFLKLMKECSEKLGEIYFDFSAFVVNLSRLEKGTGAAMIENLKEQFRVKEAMLDRTLDEHGDIHFIGRSIIVLYKELFSLLHRWADDLSRGYEKNGA